MPRKKDRTKSFAKIDEAFGFAKKELAEMHEGEHFDEDDEERPDFHAPVKFEEGKGKPIEEQEVLDDHAFARDTMHSLIEKGQEALEGILHVSKTSDHPRAFEVASGLMKNIGDLAKDLLEIQKKMGEIKNPGGTKNKPLTAPSSDSEESGDETVFRGTTDALQAAVKELRKAQVEESDE